MHSRRAKVANLSSLLFQFLFDFRQVRQDALLHFPSDAAANKAAEETAQTVGSAAIDSDEPEASSSGFRSEEVVCPTVVR